MHNTLLKIIQHRIKESIHLIQSDPEFQNFDWILFADTEFQQFKSNFGNEYSTTGGPNGPPICNKILLDWRNNCRDWICWMYSYAILNEKNLETVKEHLGRYIVEIGAGTGFIASQIKEYNHSTQIQAFDLYPTSEKQNKNEYHRNSPQFIEVEAGGTEVLTRRTLSNYNLLLCYPPPNSSMALDTIKKFKGKTFAYIGEWRGVTATNTFEIFLQLNFSLIAQQKIATFADQTCDLTIWERRDTPLKSVQEIPQEDHVYTCSKCGQQTLPDKPLYKCMFCRSHYYCSQECLQADKSKHHSFHQFIGVTPSYDKLNINNSSQFSEVSSIKITKTVKEEINNLLKLKQDKQENESSDSSDDSDDSDSDSSDFSISSTSSEDEDEEEKPKKKVKTN